MIINLESINELNDNNSKFIFFNTATDYLIYSWHYDYIKNRNFHIDYYFKNYLYNQSRYEQHHFINDYHYNICLPLYNMMLNFNFSFNDFYYKYYRGDDISYNYLCPLNDYIVFDILFYDEFKNKYEFEGDYNCLLNFDMKRTSEDLRDYHLMFVGYHTQSIINNHGTNNGKTLLIVGDSQILPEIPIFAFYYKKVLYYDNRYKNEIMNEILSNEQIDDCLVQMWSGRPLNLYEFY